VLLLICIVYGAVAVAAGVKVIVYKARMFGLFKSVLISQQLLWVNKYLMILPSSKAETGLTCAHYCLEYRHKLLVRTQVVSLSFFLFGDDAQRQWAQKTAI
jgi:hypothetical protein